MESVSTRTCERDGCENPVTGKATARFCSPQCRRENSRARGDGDSARTWVKGHWKRKPKRSAARRAPRFGRTAHHSLGLNQSVQGVFQAGKGGM